MMKKRILALILTLAMTLTLFSLTAYADGTKDLNDYDLCFDGEDWKVFPVDSKEDELYADDLNITVVDQDGEEVSSDAYELVFGKFYWDDEQQEDVFIETSEPFSLTVDDDYMQSGFGGFTAYAVAKDGSGYTGQTSPREFMLWHKYSFNWFGANADFGEEYRGQCMWSWHDYFEIPADKMHEPVIHGIAYEDVDPQYYEIAYFERGEQPDFDDPEYDQKLYPQTDPLPELPTEPGKYFARIDGKAPYYGASYVDFDIVVHPKGYAVDKATGERYGDGETIRMPIDGELYLSFELEPDDPGLMIGWRNDVLAAYGFEIDDDPTIIDGVAYAHIKAGSTQPGDIGELPYNCYKFDDIFGEHAVGWKDAQPLFGATVYIEVTAPEEEEPILLGDSDLDGKVTILDATAIQRYLASLNNQRFCLLAADANRNGTVEITDATAIQRKLVSLPTYEEIGESVSYGTYYASWNISQELLPQGSALSGVDAERAREDIRRALALLIDRSWITREIVPVSRIPASTFVSKWISDADGAEFHQSAGIGKGVGYFKADSYAENTEEAVEILKKYYQYDEKSGKFTNVPELSYIYNDSPVHEAIANKIKNDFGAVGIQLNVISADWVHYQETVIEGDYSLARSGWVVDHDDPLEFLEIWTSDNEYNMSCFGKGDYESARLYSLDLTGYGIDLKVENGTWAMTYDELIDVIRGCEDPTVKYQLLHKAEDMLMATGCIVPIYYY